MNYHRIESGRVSSAARSYDPKQRPAVTIFRQIRYHIDNLRRARCADGLSPPEGRNQDYRVDERPRVRKRVRLLLIELEPELLSGMFDGMGEQRRMGLSVDPPPS